MATKFTLAQTKTELIIPRTDAVSRPPVLSQGKEILLVSREMTSLIQYFE